MANIFINEKGYKVIEIDDIAFSGKRKIDWKGVEEYLKKYIGEQYCIDEIDDVVHVESDFPDEYANSKYSHHIYGTIAKAKANASQIIPELIKNASRCSFQENVEQKHSNDAKYGWYRCTVRFTLPTCDDRGNKVGKNVFRGQMIIRCDANGKKYIYDIISIKKET